MRITIIMWSGIILLITSIGIVELNGQYSYKIPKERKGFYLYGGLNWEHISGSRVVIPNPNQLDPVYPHTDSIFYYDCLSPHIGAHYNFEIFRSLNLRIGLEWNNRKYHNRQYRDSISIVNYPGLENVRSKTIYHNIEIPAEIAYNIQRFGFGAGAKFIVYELKVSKKYLSDEVDYKRYDHHLLFRIHQPKILYPNIFIEYLAYQNPKIPLWIKAAYEYGGEYSSTIFLSLKTKL